MQAGRMTRCREGFAEPVLNLSKQPKVEKVKGMVSFRDRLNSLGLKAMPRVAWKKLKNEWQIIYVDRTD